MSIPIRWQMQKAVCDAYEAKNHRTSTLHGHYHFLLTLITRGEGVQTLNGEDFPFSCGTMFLLSPADFHKNTTKDGESYDYFGVKFPHELLEGRLSEISVLDKLPLVIQLEGKDYSVAREIFARLVEESSFGEDRLGNEIYLQSLVEQLLIIALRSTAKKEQKKPSEFVNKTLGFLYSHFSDELSVKEAASFIGYTTNYFNTKFKEHFGVPFAEYLRNMRLSYAANLLRSSTLSITEISMESGFSCPEHFSRVFSNAFGCSPSSYRRKNTDTAKITYENSTQ